MVETNLENQQAIDALAATHLGKKGGEGYSSEYDPTLLVAIPRRYNRESCGIDENNLPFVGVDTWNCYEVSAITKKGQPVALMLKITYDADSEFHVESKSLKLYLNSFNMTRLGETAKECVDAVVTLVKHDLDHVLHTEVTVSAFQEGYYYKSELFTGHGQPLSRDIEHGYQRIQDLVDLDKVEFTTFNSDSQLLESEPASKQISWPELRDGRKVYIDFLRSNCRITHQPDWASVYIYIKGKNLPTYESLAKYIASHRTINHFHEEVNELIFKELQDTFKPDELMVAGLFSRRGGIDINPIRATHPELIPKFFTDPTIRLKKTLKQ